MSFSSVHFDIETNIVTLKLINRSTPIVCKALDYKKDNGQVVFILLDRLTHVNLIESTSVTKSPWQYTGCFVTELFMPGYEYLTSVDIAYKVAEK